MSNPLSLYPTDWYNAYGSFADIWKGTKANLITPNEAALINPIEPNPNDLNIPTFKCGKYAIQVCKPNPYDFPVNAFISKFTLLSAVKFHHSYQEAISYIQHELMGLDIPYVRIKCDYYKVIQKQDRYTIMQTQLIPWKKDEIKQDHSKALLNAIPKFDDYIIEPDNINYTPIIRNCYNLYSKFPHQPYPDQVTEKDIPVTWSFLNHIFVDATPKEPQLDEGLTYIKVLYEHPKKMLPLLSLVSRERNTGKTTFNNWFAMLFGNNYVSISPEALTKNFNSNYATKNIITFEEAFFEQQQGLEKLKHLTTAHWIDVSQKFVSEYSIPFYGKFILFSNKVTSVLRVDKEEIRLWPRIIPPIKGKRNTKIEEQLFAEIPKFLRYLLQLPTINFDNGSRMVLDENKLLNRALIDIKQESRSQLFKELEIQIEDYFNEKSGVKSFTATPTDIKKRWYMNNNQVSIAYLKKVIEEEMGLVAGEKQRYYPFDEADYYKTRVSKPYTFKNLNPNDFIDIDPPSPVKEQPFPF